MKYFSRLSFVLIFIIVFTFISVSPSNAVAQDKNSDVTEHFDNRYTFWGGYSAQSVRFLGKTRNSQTQILRIGFQKYIKELNNGFSLWYSAGIIPYLHFDYPKRDANDRRTTSNGFGFSPAGFLVKKYHSKWITPFAQTTGGIILMDEYFPTDKGRKLNFTFDITVGNIFTLNSFSDLSLGYKFHHISNAQTGSENPGLDSNFLFLTLSFH